MNSTERCDRASTGGAIPKPTASSWFSTTSPHRECQRVYGLCVGADVSMIYVLVLCVVVVRDVVVDGGVGDVAAVVMCVVGVRGCVCVPVCVSVLGCVYVSRLCAV